MSKKNKAKKYLEDFLRVAPLSHALWRSVEALSFDQEELREPVLDLGCGWGEFAGVVFNQIEMGIDINASELSQAVKGKRYKNVQWADARSLPFKANSYRTVVSVSVMEHIDEAGKVLKEAHRVLKKGGKLVFSVPTTELKNNLLCYKMLKSLGFKDLAEKYFHLHSEAFKHVNLKSERWWVNELKKSGFEIERVEGSLSPTALRIHEIFLLTAFPSQFWKLFFGKRLIMSSGIRSKVLPYFFTQFVKLDKKSKINLFIVAKKK